MFSNDPVITKDLNIISKLAKNTFNFNIQYCQGNDINGVKVKKDLILVSHIIDQFSLM